MVASAGSAKKMPMTGLCGCSQPVIRWDWSGELGMMGASLFAIIIMETYLKLPGPSALVLTA